MNDPPAILSWDEIRARLKRVQEMCPRVDILRHQPDCVGHILRVRDIAEWTGVSSARLYHISSGSRVYNRDDTQARFSQFFHLWERGKLTKSRGADGKWAVRYTEFTPAPDEGAAAAPRSHRVDFATGRLKV